jgi:DNA polymerase III subunit delta'
MSFSQLKGQTRQVALLQEALQKSHLAHGYLFSGPEGVGKKLCALTLAKAVNCLQSTQDSCDECESCRKIEKKTHPDVHFFSAGCLPSVSSSSASLRRDGTRSESAGREADTITIDTVRRLQKEIYLRAYEGRTKVFIIDNAELMSAEAANALLKVLEEPPRNSLIMLITSKPGLLFKTVVSRCWILKFAALSKQLVQEILIRDYAVKKEDARFLSYISEGRLGKALRLKDSDTAAHKNKIIDQFFYTPHFTLDIRERDLFRGYLNILATWLRDVYYLKAGLSDAELIHSDRKEEVTRTADRMNALEQIDAQMQAVLESMALLEQNVNTKLILAHLRAVIRQ